MTPGASNYLVYFIFREVDMEYWRDLAKGTMGLLLFFGASLIVLNMWISWELWTARRVPLYLPASWLNCDLWTMGCSFLVFFSFFSFDFLYFYSCFRGQRRTGLWILHTLSAKYPCPVKTIIFYFLKFYVSWQQPGFEEICALTVCHLSIMLSDLKGLIPEW
ncbi:hypothetical protein V8C43DRAFT_231716 [Trichoderma afarasin]